MTPNNKILDMLPNLTKIGDINDMSCYITYNLFIYIFDDILYCIDIDKFLSSKYQTISVLLSSSNFLHLINGEIHIMPNTIIHPPSLDLYNNIYISDEMIRAIKLNFVMMQ